MNRHEFNFGSATLAALPSGALFWPLQSLLVVSDLHLGKAARQARFGGAQLPPYDTSETLTRLSRDLDATGAQTVICLGDSFDAPALSEALPDNDQLWIAKLQAGRVWIWIEGNHDPGPVGLGGAHLKEHQISGLTFRHIAEPNAVAEVSGHYHPKARLTLRGRRLAKPCFLVDDTRLILPAYGAYTGGMFCDTAPLPTILQPDAQAILCCGSHMLQQPAFEQGKRHKAS